MMSNTDNQKEALFRDVRSGNSAVCFLDQLKNGTGTNCQKKLVALHELDCPWRAADVAQREGRILRQGNDNEEVAIYRYVTESLLMRTIGTWLKQSTGSLFRL